MYTICIIQFNGHFQCVTPPQKKQNKRKGFFVVKVPLLMVSHQYNVSVLSNMCGGGGIK